MCVSETIRKEAAYIQPGSKGLGSAGNQIDSKKNNSAGVFIRTGRVERDREALKITFKAFEKEHVAYIGCQDVRTLLQPGAPSVAVTTIQEGIDGSAIIHEAGKAWRSRSGKALMIRTTQSDGEISVSWQKFVQVVNREISYAYISRMESLPDTPIKKQDNSDIRAGLEGGF